MKVGGRNFLSFLSFPRGWKSSIFFTPLTSIFMGLFLTFQAFAQGTGVKPITDTASAHSAICSIFSFMFWALMSISVIMVLWAAYLYVTAQDDVEKTSEARRTIFYAAIGIIIAILAGGFPSLVAGIFPNGTSGVRGC